jgi:hypothetical protein
MPWCRIRRLLVVSVALLPACDGADSGFDPLVTNQAAASVLGALQRSPALQTLDVMGEKIVLAAPSGTLAAALPGALFPRAPFATWAGERAGGAPVPAPEAPAAPILPADLLGKTLTYNVAMSRYEISAQTGAPGNGVRFILYDVDLVQRAIKQPLAPVGHLDLTDESTPAAAALRLVVVIANATLLDYQASASFTTSSISFSAEGVVSDGETSVEFQLTQRISAGPTITVNYRLAVPENDVSLSLDATATGSGSTITLTIQDGGNTTAVHVTETAQGITGTITHNGRTVINISGTSQDPVFTDVNGNALTQAHLDALEALADMIDVVFDAFDALLGPAHRMLGFPWPEPA